ncbi:unnamed protein product [Blepharisma stoltei]|uniref:Uncharacterized protein n=1 Tax=Blepharisma stoltei TaxID=1481888 RepID=A0AAU9K6Z6_9CILI|nr:unnamed protein product [Blepharisma stoltei]
MNMEAKPRSYSSGLNPYASAFEPDMIKDSLSSLHVSNEPSQKHQAPTEESKTPMAHEENKSHDGSLKVYTTEFLLSLKNQCTSLPQEISIPQNYAVSLKTKKKKKPKRKRIQSESTALRDVEGQNPQESTSGASETIIPSDKPKE